MISVKSLGLDSSIILKKSTFKNLENPKAVCDAIKKNRDLINDYASKYDMKIRGAYTQHNNGQDALYFSLANKTKHHKVNEFLSKIGLFHYFKVRAKARDIYHNNHQGIAQTLIKAERELNYDSLYIRKP